MSDSTLQKEKKKSRKRERVDDNITNNSSKKIIVNSLKTEKKEEVNKEEEKKTHELENTCLISSLKNESNNNNTGKTIFSSEKKKNKNKNKSISKENNNNEKPEKILKTSNQSLLSFWEYKEHIDTTNSDSIVINSYLDENRITLSSEGNENIPEVRPVRFFEHAGLPKTLENLLLRDFKTPTAIQAISWPAVFRGYDVISIAQTGSGKTLAFGVPAIMHAANERLKSSKNGRGSPAQPSVLVILPTRELAIQVHVVLEGLGNTLGNFEGKLQQNIRSVCLFGGMSKGDQISDLRRGADIIVATPGRLSDLASSNNVIKLDCVSLLVLDEADRMLDLGFEHEIRKILAQCVPLSQGRRSLMFSATWPNDVRSLAREFLRAGSVLKISAHGAGEFMAAPSGVVQHVDVIAPQQREAHVNVLLKRYLSMPCTQDNNLENNSKSSKGTNRVLVFALYKREAARMGENIARRFENVSIIHGDMSQPARCAALASFKADRPGKTSVLVATDVAARGLDIPDVSCVINATFPLTIEDYVHRIGRTGRAGKSGIAHTIFTLNEKSHAGELVDVLRKSSQKVPEELLMFGTAIKKKEHSAYGAFYHNIDPTVSGKRTVFESDDENEV